MEKAAVEQQIYPAAQPVSDAVVALPLTAEQQRAEEQQAVMEAERLLRMEPKNALEEIRGELRRSALDKNQTPDEEEIGQAAEGELSQRTKPAVEKREAEAFLKMPKEAALQVIKETLRNKYLLEGKGVVSDGQLLKEAEDQFYYQKAQALTILGKVNRKITEDKLYRKLTKDTRLMGRIAKEAKEGKDPNVLLLAEYLKKKDKKGLTMWLMLAILAIFGKVIYDNLFEPMTLGKDKI